MKLFEVYEDINVLRLFYEDFYSDNRASEDIIEKKAIEALEIIKKYKTYFKSTVSDPDDGRRKDDDLDGGLFKLYGIDLYKLVRYIFASVFAYNFNEKLLMEYIKFPSNAIRMYILRNPNVPISVVNELTSDYNQEVSMFAKSIILDKFPKAND